MKAALTGLAALGTSLVLASAGARAAPILPIAATGYTNDIVFGAGETGASINGTMDGGPGIGGSTWYGVGRNPDAPATGLPTGPTASQSTPGDLTFALQPFAAASNAVLLNGGQSGALAITAPANLSRLALVGSVGRHGDGDVLSVVVNHANGQTETFTGGFVSQDWFSGSSQAYTANGRTSDGVNFDNVNNNNPRLYQDVFPLAITTSPVTSVGLAFSGTGHVAIMAISGEAVPEPGSIALLGGVGLLGLARRRRRSPALA